jgi:hypothetical protein
VLALKGFGRRTGAVLRSVRHALRKRAALVFASSSERGQSAVCSLQVQGAECLGCVERFMLMRLVA